MEIPVRSKKNSPRQSTITISESKTEWRRLCHPRSSLLGRSETLNFGSTEPERRYLRIVFRDNPVRLDISRIET
jgi:hypothetical protein